MDDGPLAVPTFEIASRQASLAFERTLVSLDQFLLSSIRTSLSLIGFGFAMFLFFNQVGVEVGVNLRAPARNFGLSLVALGVGLLATGLCVHRARHSALRRQMADMHRRRLLAEVCPGNQAPVAILALLLLIAGLLVMAGIIIRIGPFA